MKFLATLFLIEIIQPFAINVKSAVICFNGGIFCNKINLEIGCSFVKRNWKLVGMEENTESTMTSIDEYMENFLNQGTRDVLSDSMLSVFKNIVNKYEERLSSVQKLQAEFDKQLSTSSKLFQELEIRFEDIPDLSNEVKLLINTKRKIANISALAIENQVRLNNLRQKIEDYERIDKQ